MNKTAKRAPIDPAEHRRRHLPGMQHKVLRDPQVREFVDQRIQAMTFEQLEEECRERFSDERAPSKSALHRYWDTFLREGGPRLSARRRGRKPHRATQPQGNSHTERKTR